MGLPRGHGGSSERGPSALAVDQVAVGVWVYDQPLKRWGHCLRTRPNRAVTAARARGQSTDRAARANLCFPVRTEESGLGCWVRAVRYGVSHEVSALSPMLGRVAEGWPVLSLVRRQAGCRPARPGNRTLEGGERPRNVAAGATTSGSLLARGPGRAHDRWWHGRHGDLECEQEGPSGSCR